MAAIQPICGSFMPRPPQMGPAGTF